MCHIQSWGRLRPQAERELYFLKVETFSDRIRQMKKITAVFPKFKYSIYQDQTLWRGLILFPISSSFNPLHHHSTPLSTSPTPRALDPITLVHDPIRFMCCILCLCSFVKYWISLFAVRNTKYTSFIWKDRQFCLFCRIRR